MDGVEPSPAIAGLPQAARHRLDLFGAAFDELSSEDYPLYTVVPDADGSADPLERSVIDRLGASVRSGVEAAVTAFQQEAEVNLSRRFVPGFRMPQAPNLPFPLEDRVRFMASLRRAVIAIAVWDQLSDEERTSLLGIWDRVAETAGLDV